MCSRRTLLLLVCSLQLLTITERQIFDFLGYMWAPILANFFHIIFVIFGFFGAYQFRGKYLISYSVWNVIWIGWNSFLICFYLNVGILDRDSDILNLGTGSVSWFEVNGPGCKPNYSINITSDDPYRPIRPERVDGCILEYQIVEVIHSFVQSFLSLLGLIGAICIGRILWDDDDSFDFMGGDAKSPQHTAVHPMYVSYQCIPTSISATNTHNNKNNTYNNNNNNNDNQLGVVLKSINHSNTNSLSSTYIKNLNANHQKVPPPHYQLIDHRQLSGGINMNSNNKLNLSKSTSAQIIKRNPSFTSTNRSDIRYTEIITATDEYLNQLNQMEKEMRNKAKDSDGSYYLPSSTNTTAVASPIITSKLLSTNQQQQQLIQKHFGIQNPLNNLMRFNKQLHNGNNHQTTADDEDDEILDSITAMDYGSNNSTLLIQQSHHKQQQLPQLHQQNQQLPQLHQQHQQQHQQLPQYPPPPPLHQHQQPQQQHQQPAPSQKYPFSANNYAPGVRPDFNLNKYLNNQINPINENDVETGGHQPNDKYVMPQQYVTRSPNLNRMSRRRQSQQQIPNTHNQQHPLENSHSNSKLSSVNFYDHVRDKPLPPRHMNSNQFADPQQHVMHPMYRVRSQDRLSNRLRRQSNNSHNNINNNNQQHHQSQRPRSFCTNNMINYNDYKDSN